MNDQNLRNKWTVENITYLKFAYLQGSPLKQIAARLNRSVSAINKVLARHNLRTHSRMERLPTISRPTPRKIQQRRNLGAHIRKQRQPTIKVPNDEHRQWVSFDHVICWMKSQNIHIQKSKNDIYYEIDGYPKNKHQILVVANLLRDQNKLPIFFVEGITCL